MSITKLSPNWACQMGPIHFINFLLSGSSLQCKTLCTSPAGVYLQEAEVEVPDHLHHTKPPVPFCHTRPWISFLTLSSKSLTISRELFLSCKIPFTFLPNIYDRGGSRVDMMQETRGGRGGDFENDAGTDGKPV